MTVQYPGMMPTNGIERIAAERHRHVSVEGYTPEHDLHHKNGELTAAAKVYMGFADWQRRYPDHPMTGQEFLDIPDIHFGKLKEWPWDEADFKPADHVRNLEKAGALIAAEIDRVLALQERA